MNVYSQACSISFPTLIQDRFIINTTHFTTIAKLLMCIQNLLNFISLSGVPQVTTLNSSSKQKKIQDLERPTHLPKSSDQALFTLLAQDIFPQTPNQNQIDQPWHLFFMTQRFNTFSSRM